MIHDIEVTYTRYRRGTEGSRLLCLAVLNYVEDTFGLGLDCLTASDADGTPCFGYPKPHNFLLYLNLARRQTCTSLCLWGYPHQYEHLEGHDRLHFRASLPCQVKIQLRSDQEFELAKPFIDRSWQLRNEGLDIVPLLGDVYHAAVDNHCHALCLWLRSGFCGLHLSWANFWDNHQEHLTIPANMSPWSRANERLLAVDPPIGELQLIYVHYNPFNWTGVPHGMVSWLMYQALETINQPGISRVAMNGLPAVMDSGKPDASADVSHGYEMIAAAQRWAQGRQAQIRTLYLADLGGTFQKSSPAWR